MKMKNGFMLVLNGLFGERHLLRKVWEWTIWDRLHLMESGV